ncbi:hypothetical protein GC170_18630 [bacterium]|nr:hypothetical protein [bacterium]
MIDKQVPKSSSSQPITIHDTLALALGLMPLGSQIFNSRTWQTLATWSLALSLGLALRNLFLVNRRLTGTALRPATVWAMVAVVCSIVAIVFADVEVPGRPRQAIFVHLAFLTMLASLVSVLGARKPGESAWALLCGVFLVIGLLPMLEGIGLAKRFDTLDRLRLESPWSYFLVLVIIAGAGNYLPTRYGFSALILGSGLGYHLSLLWKPDGRSEWRGDHWFVLPCSLAVSIAIGAILARRSRKYDPPMAFHRLWIPFRDAWGAAWALRVLERVNQTAARNGWPERLTWFGLVDVPEMQTESIGDGLRLESSSNPSEFEKGREAFANGVALAATLTVFLKRFGDPETIRNLGHHE